MKIYGYLVAFIFAIGIWIAQSYFESKAFERVTGKQVAVIDAMFLSLRVQESSN